MRTTQTMTISIPPRMLEEFERVRRAENRTRSELVREALRVYFERRVPVVELTKAERAAIRSCRVEIKRGDYVSLAQLHNELDPQDRKAS
jgi:metal-responsive CopG/Arc/MetJ family transcriptional regulator